MNMKFSQGKFWLLLFLLFVYPTVASGEMLVGVLFSGNIPYYRSMHTALLDGLKEKLPADEKVKYVTQFPAPDPVALSNSAKKLIVGGVDLLITYGYPATKAAIEKESTTPIVYIGVNDPDSLITRKPTLTGIGYKIPLSSLLRYYKETVEIGRLCVVYSPLEEDSVQQMNDLAEMAAQQNINIMKLDIKSRGDLKKLNDIGKGDAVFMTGSAQAHVMIKTIMALLRQKKVPAVDIFPDSTEEGFLITLYQSPEQQGNSAAEIVAKVITGENPEKIDPVVQTQTELVFNKVEAKNLRVNFPAQYIGEATRVIE